MGVGLGLAKHRGYLVDRIDPDFGLLDDLLATGVLTREDLHEITLTNNTTEKKNIILLDIVLEKNETGVFNSALRKSGQNHLVNYLDADGKYEDKFGDDWPLRESDVRRLNINHARLVDLLDTSDLCNRLYSEKVINNRQKQFISFKSTDAEKNEALLDILTKCSIRQYNTTINCLKDSKQSHIADLFSEGGAILRVHANLEGAVEKEDELKEEFISKTTKVLEDSLVEKASRLLDMAKQRIISARKGQGIIVIYYQCQTNDELKTDRLKEKVHLLGAHEKVHLTLHVFDLKMAAMFYGAVTGAAAGAAAGTAIGSGILPGIGSFIGGVVGGVVGAVGGYAVADAIFNYVLGLGYVEDAHCS